MAVVWITGAHGFIGRHLALHLGRRGDRVCGIGHGAWPEFEAAAWGVGAWVNGELEGANLELLRRAGGVPEVVFHLAGGSSVGASLAAPLEDFSRTVAAAARLFDWLRAASPGTPVVVVSSAAVYGAGHEGPIAESASPRPYSPYGHHKLMLEQLCAAYRDGFGISSRVVRLFSVYGPWLRKQLLWDLCSRLAGGQRHLRLGGSGGELRDWTEVRDVVRLLAMLGDIASGEAIVVNGGSGHGTRVAAIAEEVARAWGGDIEIEFSGERRPGDPFSLVADCRRLAALGFEWQIPVESGIDEFVRWFRLQHP